MLRYRCVPGVFVCLVLCCVVAFAQNPVTFTTHTSTAGLSPQAVYAVDVNNDGIPDLVEDATSSGSNTVSIQIGNGDGTFQAQKQIAVLASGYDGLAPMASGDFNGDGKVDLVFALHFRNQLVMLLGNGDGTFQPMKVETIPFGGSSGSQWFDGGQVLAADFNHDGKLDLAAFAQVTTSTTNSTGVYILPGDGTGSFGTPRLVSSLKYVEDLALGDFDGDGNADIAVGNNISEYETDVHVLYGNGAYGFTDSSVYQSTCNCYESDFFFASGDVNSDGRTDLFGFPNENQLVVLTSQPGRQWTTFSMATTATLNQAVNRDDHAAPPPILLGDFNGDGTMDLAAIGTQGIGTTQAQDVFDFFLANGSGGYTEQGVPVSSGTGNIVVADFNRDLKPDVATINAFIAYPGTGAQMTVGLNQTADGSWSPCAYPARGQGITLCSPGTTSGNAVHFTAAANSFGQLRKMELWVDGRKTSEQHHTWGNRAWLDLSTTLSNGTHSVTVFAADIDNRLQKFTSTVQVGASSGSCSAPSSAGVNLCTPASGSTVSSPVQVLASATVTGKLASMELWVDGVKRYTETSSTTLQTSLALSDGTHRFAVLAKNTSGQVWEKVVDATVQTSSSCSAPTSPGVHMCSPANGATVSSPVDVQATATVTGQLSSMQLWVDGAKVFTQFNSSALHKSISLSAGTHRIAVLAVNNSGQKWEQAVNTTVQ